MIYILTFDEIDCANCAAKVEQALNHTNLFEEVKINFMLRQITVHTKDKIAEEELTQKVHQIASQVEPGIKVDIKNSKVANKKTAKKVTHMHQQGGECCGAHDHHHGHEHGHSHNISISDYKAPDETTKLAEKKHDRIMIGRVLSGLVLLIMGVIMNSNPLLVVGYIVTGYDVIYSAAKSLIKGRVLDENTLMAIATVAAFAIGEYPEAVAVMIFYQIGEFFQHKAVAYSRAAIADLMDIRPDFARVAGEIVDPEEVEVGEIIEVRAGEKIPLDGKVIKGASHLDTVALTGESVPRFVEAGEEVLSGSINKEGVLQIQVTTSFGESTVSKILELIENASSKKSTAENFITKFAAWYTPIVVLLALLTALIPSLITGDWQHWIHTSIVFLVISCPCALVVSVPLGFFGGIGAASKHGVLVKGSNYLEKLNEIDTVVLDKTGTITKGKFGVTSILPVQGVKEDELLKYAVWAEQLSSHPIAHSIMSYGKQIELPPIKDYKELAGKGIEATVEGHIVFAGNEQLMNMKGISYKVANQVGTVIHIAVDNIYKGCIVAADEIKEDSKEAIRSIRKQGIKEFIMLTGDKKEVGEAVAKEVGIDRAYTELLPQDKVSKVEQLIQGGKKVLFVGDGINDAPVLALSDIGVSMGGAGSDAAVEASDIVILEDKLTGVTQVMDISKTTRRIVMQNIVFAIGIKVIVMLLGVMGVASMALAIFADVGVSVLAVLNSIRILYRYK